MSDQSRDDPAPALLQDILADYLTAFDAGSPPDRQSLLDAYPQLAGELREFFANHDRLAHAMHGSCPSPRNAQDFADPARGSSSAATNGLLNDTLAFSAGAFAGPDGRTFAQYEIIEEIDRGGMGVIFRALDTRLDRQVALKMIRAGELASREEIDRFFAEAQAAAGLEHPGIVPIYDVGEFHGRHYIAMRLIDGETLAARLMRGAVPPREAALLVRKVATAMQFAHVHGVIHRDLKPANILIDERGEPMITDFGLAKNVESTSGLTLSGQILGTPAFMAPEQATGARKDTQQLADVYALGAILYALCTGSAPFEATNQVDLLMQVIDRDPALPRSRDSTIPRSLERIILRCLEKEPPRRFPSAAALAEDLEHFLKDEPLTTRSSDVLQALRKWGRREPALVSHLCGILPVMVNVSIATWALGYELTYAFRHLGVLAVWVAVSFGLQQLLNRRETANLGRFLWSAADVLLVTLMLYNAFPPRAPLLIGYPLLIAASGLFARVRLVVFTTAAAMIGFSTLVVLTTPEEPQKLHYCTVFVVGLIVTGFAVGAQVRRLRALSRYYEPVES